MQVLKREKSQGFYPASAKYLLAFVLLLVAIIGAYAILDARRSQSSFYNMMKEEGLAIAESLEISSKNAIASNALLERLIAQRLLDNARLIDLLFMRIPAESEYLEGIARENRLHKVEILTIQGEPLPGIRALIRGRFGDDEEAKSRIEKFQQRMRERMMRRGMMHQMEEKKQIEQVPPERTKDKESSAERRDDFRYRSRMPHFYQPIIEGKMEEVRQGFGERQFWAGREFGVAVRRRFVPGIIVIRADAEYILNFQKEIGMQKIIQDLGVNPGIKYISLQDKDLKYVAHSNQSLIGKAGEDSLLRDILKKNTIETRTLPYDGNNRVFEVIKPFALGESNMGIFRVGLSMEPLEKIQKSSIQHIIFYSIALLTIGVIGVVVIFINQSRHLRKIKGLEEEMARKEKLSVLGNMAAAVAHEIRNPLNAISMGLQRMEREFQPQGESDKKDYEQFMKLIRGEVKRLDSIVAGFLKLSKPSSMDMKEFDLGDLIKNILSLLKEEAESHNIRYIENIPPEPVKIIADSEQLRQAFINIIINSFQAMPDGGNLSLSIQPKKDLIEIAISDTGSGIPQSIQEKIFDPYFSTKENGTGLGLTIAHRIISDHKGKIEIQSEQGKGTTFIITLPVNKI